MGACLYTITFNDYVWTFKQITFIIISRRVANQVMALTKVNFSCGGQPNLMTQNNLQMQFCNMHWVHHSQLESHTWKGINIFSSCKQKPNLLSRVKGIHINTIMLTPRMENDMCKLSGLLIVFTTMKLQMNGKLHVQIEWPSCIIHHNEVTDEWKITCANWVALLQHSSQWSCGYHQWRCWGPRNSLWK